MKHLSRLVTFQTNDPDHLIETLGPAVPANLFIQPGKRVPFYAAMKLSRLPRLSLFKGKISSARLLRREPQGYCSITIPLRGSFQAGTQGRMETFATHTAYVNHWASPFDLWNGDDIEVLVANIDPSLLEEYARKLNGSEESEPLRFGPCLSLVSPSGASFWRYLSFIWSELERDGAMGESELILQELETTLVTMLLYAWQEQAVDPRQRDKDGSPAALRRAEDYILAHLAESVSIADLSAVSGVNARSLGTMFRKRHGHGPMGFVKACRLEAAQRALLAADPASTTVTEVAMEFGFFHLGQFSKDYRQAFQELPSETLRR